MQHFLRQTLQSGPFVHRIDPVLADIAGVYLWWYGLSYALGFLHVRLFLQQGRDRLGLTRREVYSLSLVFAISVLAGGRAIQVAFDEWPFYHQHPWMVPAYWLGGMATHGLLLGAGIGTWAFAHAYKKPLLELADALVIPGAFLMGMGRIGNFIDGQIVGGFTDVWWGVRFPDAEGFRHPVVLYDGAKNLLLVPYLLRVRRTNRTPGAVAARFVFWYAFARIFIDLFRDYPTHRLALGTGQTLNIVMACLGIVLLIRSRLRRQGRLSRRLSWAPRTAVSVGEAATGYQQLAFASLLLFCLTIPSNWTQDIPARYGKRHAGLKYSLLYPRIQPQDHIRATATHRTGRLGGVYEQGCHDRGRGDSCWSDSAEGGPARARTGETIGDLCTRKRQQPFQHQEPPGGRIPWRAGMRDAAA